MDIDLSGGKTFGGHWSGYDGGNITEGVVSTDVDHSPSGTSNWPGLNVTIWWVNY